MIVHVADDRVRTIGEAPLGARIRATSATDSDRTPQAAIRSARFRKFGFNAFRRDRYLAQDALRQEDIDQLVAQQLRRGLDRKTVNNITAVLSSLVKYAVKNKVIGPVDLSFTIKVQDSEIVAVAASDVDKLAAAADERYCAAILLAADAGLRIGEIRALRWSEVNELMREISISQSYDRTGELTETKGWERRVVPISDRLWSALKRLHRVGPL